MVQVGGWVNFLRPNLGSTSRELGYGEAHLLLGNVVSGEEALEEDITETEDREGPATGSVAVRTVRVRGLAGSRSGMRRRLG